MQGHRSKVREELYRLLLDEDEGVAYNLVPRLLADPDSLTPEIRWCLLYLIRGVGCIASRYGLLRQGGLLDSVIEGFEEVRRTNERLDWLWFTVVREDENHWIQRYESTDIGYSMEELGWLQSQLTKLWEVERQRIALAEPPLTPLAIRRRQGLFPENQEPTYPVSRSI